MSLSPLQLIITIAPKEVDFGLHKHSDEFDELSQFCWICFLDCDLVISCFSEWLVSADGKFSFEPWMIASEKCFFGPER